MSKRRPVAATTSDNRRIVADAVIAQRARSHHRERVWRAIEATPNFWTTLKPLEPGAVKRLYQLTGEHNWEVFFITQRPATAGATVQWQTQKWLVEHGFSMPSVIPLSGGRGKCAAALQLDYLVDDTPQNCVDVLVGFVDSRDPAGGSATIRSPKAARADSASAPRATSTKCSTCSFRRPRRAPTPRCSKNSENSSAGNNCPASVVRRSTKIERWRTETPVDTRDAYA